MFRRSRADDGLYGWVNRTDATLGIFIGLSLNFHFLRIPTGDAVRDRFIPISLMGDVGGKTLEKSTTLALHL